MRFAVVHFAVSRYRQRYCLITILRDRQYAGVIGYLIITLLRLANRRDRVVAYILARLTAQIIDDIVVVNRSLYRRRQCRINFAIYLALVVSRYGYGDGVIDRDDILVCISPDRDFIILGVISLHRGFLIFLIQRRARTRRQLFADGHGAGLVVGNLDGGAVQVMVDGVARGVELEVQLQHQRTVAGDNAGLNVGRGLVVDVLAVFLGGLIGFGHGNGRVRGAIAGYSIFCRLRIRSVRFLIVELDGVLGVGVRRPDGVEDVVAVVVYLHGSLLSNNGVRASLIVLIGRPAHEAVAVAGEGIRDGFNGFVVVVFLLDIVSNAAVGVIGQGDLAGTRAPLGGEGDDVPFISVIALDLVLVAGLVGGRAVRPAEEVLTIISNQLARGLEVSKAVLRVGLAIHRSGYVVFDGNVFNSEGAVLGVVGVEGDVAVNLGVNVEGLAGAVRAGAPAAPRIAVLVLHDRCLKVIQLISDRAAVRNGVDRLAGTADDRSERGSTRGRCNPLRVNNHAAYRHLLSREIILLTSVRVIIPTIKFVVIRNTCRRISWLIASSV